MKFNMSRKGCSTVLRNDTIYLLSQNQDSSVPSTAKIQKQVEKRVGHVYGSVRLATGRVVGSDSNKTSRDKKNSIEY